MIASHKVLRLTFKWKEKDARRKERGMDSLGLFPPQVNAKVRRQRSVPGPQHSENYYEVKQVTSFRSTKQVTINLFFKILHTSE
jgi:hypothetical protein